jgi:hypothetical protein
MLFLESKIRKKISIKNILKKKKTKSRFLYKILLMNMESLEHFIIKSYSKKINKKIIKIDFLFVNIKIY